MTSDWYRDFFHGVVVDLWRKAVPEEQTTAEVEFLVRELDVGPGARLLDVPCGDGRHARALASRGFAMTGVDISEEFLAAARGEDTERKVDWVLGDMRELPRKADFDGAYCFGNSFSYLDHQGNCDFLAALADSLRPGGRFALDTGIAAESILPTLQPRIEHTMEDIEFSAENHYCAQASRLDTDYTFVRDGRSETRTGSHQVYTVAELGRLLGKVGLGVRECYSGLDGEAYEVGCHRLLLIAEKPAS